MSRTRGLRVILDQDMLRFAPGQMEPDIVADAVAALEAAAAEEAPVIEDAAEAPQQIQQPQPPPQPEGPYLDLPIIDDHFIGNWDQRRRDLFAAFRRACYMVYRAGIRQDCHEEAVSLMRRGATLFPQLSDSLPTTERDSLTNAYDLSQLEADINEYVEDVDLSAHVYDAVIDLDETIELSDVDLPEVGSEPGSAPESDEDEDVILYRDPAADDTAHSQTSSSGADADTSQESVIEVE
jgi:hypothetical protein